MSDCSEEYITSIIRLHKEQLEFSVMHYTIHKEMKVPRIDKTIHKLRLVKWVFLLFCNLMSHKVKKEREEKRSRKNQTIKLLFGILKEVFMSDLGNKCTRLSSTQLLFMSLKNSSINIEYPPGIITVGFNDNISNDFCVLFDIQT